jgi:hypothetical protein
MKRMSISVTDWQYEALEYLATQTETSVAHIVRDALRGALPRLVELARFLEDPANSPHDALQVIEQMEALLGNLAPADAAESGVAAAAAPPPPRRFKKPTTPPSGNTGAHE